MTKIKYCKNCKHLGHDGMFGLICDVNGDNTKYDCPKYEEDGGDGMIERFVIDTSEKNVKMRDKQYNCFYVFIDDMENIEIFCKRLNELQKQNDDLKRQNKRRKKKIKHHRVVIEELGSSIMGYKGQLKKLQSQIREIKEQMEDTGALTKRQLEEILND